MGRLASLALFGIIGLGICLAATSEPAPTSQPAKSSSGPSSQPTTQSSQPATKGVGTAYKPTDEETRILSLHKEAFALRGVDIKHDKGKLHLKAGDGMALWRNGDRVVQGGDQVEVNWLVLKDARNAFEKDNGKEPILVFFLYTVSDKVTSIQMVMKEKTDFANWTGVMTVPTPDKSLFKGKGTLYLRLGSEGNVQSNILPIRVEYAEQ